MPSRYSSSMLRGASGRRGGGRSAKMLTSGWMRKTSGKIAIAGDDGSVAAVLPQLLAEDGPDAPPR